MLAGAEPPRRRARPVELADVVRVAIGEVEDFTRIHLLALDETTVGGNVAVDLAHLLSELMENATQFSPPDTTVEVVGHRTPDGGYTVTVADQGIGMSADQLAEANALLTSPAARRPGPLPLPRLHRRRSPGSTPSGHRPPDRFARRRHHRARRPARRRAVGPERGRRPESARPATAPPRRPRVGRGPPPAGRGRHPVPAHADPEADATVADGPTSLSDALPDGEDFERGLASLMGPDTGGPSDALDDDELNRSFWGELADAPSDDTFADLADAPSDDPSTEPADGAERRPVHRTGLGCIAAAPGRHGWRVPRRPAPDWEPAPDWLDGELASVEPDPDCGGRRRPWSHRRLRPRPPPPRWPGVSPVPP